LEFAREKLEYDRKQLEEEKNRTEGENLKSKKENDSEKKVQKLQGRQAVDEWLSQHDLSQYYQKFIDCGYESLEVCALIDDTELVAMDIGKLGHRKALIQACHQLREMLY